MRKFYAADAHCDFLYYAATDNFDIRTRTKSQCMTLDRMKEGGVALQFFAAWTDTKEKRRSPLQQTLEMIAAYYKMLDENKDAFVPFSKEFMPENGKIATVLAIEDLSCMEDNINNLDIFHRLGVRSITLTWNYKNGLACPSTAKRDTGLTQLGRETVRRMEELNIAVDLAHLGDRGIDEVLSITSSPVFSSHTNARDLFYSPRSLKDEHIKEIAKRGGVVGVNFYNKQLTANPTATISDIADHICHVVKVGGLNCAAIGSDFDGMSIYPDDLKHSGHFPRLANELKLRGFSDDDIERIMYKNLAEYISRFV